MPVVNEAAKIRILYNILQSNPFVSTLQVALFTTYPDENNIGSQVLEPVVGTYARVNIDNFDFAYTGGTPELYYPNTITFPLPDAVSWGTIRAWALIDSGVPAGSVTLADIVFWDKLLVSRAPTPNTPVMFLANKLKLVM
jgi:hypothetical protein